MNYKRKRVDFWFWFAVVLFMVGYFSAQYYGY